MLPQLVSPLIQLPLVNPQFLRQLLGADRLHSLHCSSLVFPTPPSISLPLLHSLLRGEFPCCLILGGHSTTVLSQGILSVPCPTNRLGLHLAVPSKRIKKRLAVMGYKQLDKKNSSMRSAGAAFS